MSIKPQSILEIEATKDRAWKTEMEQIPDWYKKRAFLAAIIAMVGGLVIGIIMGALLWGA